MKNPISIMLRSCAVAALLAAPIGGATYAQSQDAQSQQQQGQQQQTQGQEARQAQPQQPTQGQPTNQGGQSGDGQQQAGQNQAPASDQLVATVGDAEIRGADVLTVIGMLPEPLRAQQPDMLVPIALDQLIFRELILQQAREQNLKQDPEVHSLVQQSSASAEEDALMQVWLRRELESAVSDQAVQQTYDQLSQNATSQVPPLEQIRPQIEQHLRQQAVADLRQRLAQEAEIVLYDPSGQPIQQPQGGAAQGGSAQQAQQGGAAQDGNTQQGQQQQQSGAQDEPSAEEGAGSRNSGGSGN